MFKCVHGLAPNLFEKYFCKQNHTKGTRGNNVNLVVPPIRTEAARKTFFYQGTQIYNKLPTTLETETLFLGLKRALKRCNKIPCFFLFFFLLNISLIYSSLPAEQANLSKYCIIIII